MTRSFRGWHLSLVLFVSLFFFSFPFLCLISRNHGRQRPWMDVASPTTIGPFGSMFSSGMISRNSSQAQITASTFSIFELLGYYSDDLDEMSMNRSTWNTGHFRQLQRAFDDMLARRSKDITLCLIYTYTSYPSFPRKHSASYELYSTCTEYHYDAQLCKD